MAGLKTLVIVMGIAVIVGATVVVTTIIQRGGALGEPVARGTINLPAGARVMETRIDGGRIMLRLSLQDGRQRIVIVDAETGAPIAVHELAPEGKGR
jgi:hypothetical protein